MNSLNFIKIVSEYVKQLLLDKTPSELSFHNYRHTKDVVTAAKKLAVIENIPEDEKEILIIAAWFRNTGFIEKYDDHHAENQKIALHFLRSLGYSKSNIEMVVELLGSTKSSQNFQGKLSEILEDAQMCYLSGNHLVVRMSSLRSELEFINETKFTDDVWRDQKLEFLQSHKYKTPYGKSILEKRKQVNIHRMLTKPDKMRSGIQTNLFNHFEPEVTSKILS